MVEGVVHIGLLPFFRLFDSHSSVGIDGERLVLCKESPRV